MSQDTLSTLKAAKRLLASKRAHDSLLAFTKLTMPDPADVDDPDRSLYQPAIHHQAIAEALERVERGDIRRLIISMPPRHGKSELATKRFPAWCLGRHPHWQVIQVTYSQEFAEDFGRKVREIIRADTYRQVFPGLKLKTGSQAADRLEMEGDGILVFTGVGGAVTGRGADLLIVDDPVKNREEAESPATRQKIWDFFTSTAYTRLMPGGRIIIIMCMTGDTPVLMDNGDERLLRDVRAGDRVATYEDGRLSVSTVRNWVNHGPDRVFEIKMKSGASVKANARHPFLVEEKGKTKWQRTASLKPGSVILRATKASGEASPAPLMDATSSPSAGVCACRTTTGGSGPPASGLHQPMPIRVAPRACGTVMELTSRNTNACAPRRAGPAPSASDLPPENNRPFIGPESSASTIATQAARCAGSCATTATSSLDTEKAKPCYAPPLSTYEIMRDTVVAVVDAGVEDVFDIEVERTENFIANGLVSHNTRWHEDDLVGRIFNPDFMPAEEADKWMVLELPAIKVVNGEEKALWPERYPLSELQSIRKTLGPRDFSALYQQKPTPEDGDYFKKADVLSATYKTPQELPRNLVWYGASDHALKVAQGRDYNVIGCVGVDENQDIWLPPDIYWGRCETDKQVEEMIAQIRRRKPLNWWSGRDHITGAIGPYLKKRMAEERVHCWIEELPERGDKRQKARAAQGMVATRRIHMPEFAPWFPAALSQMLKFDGDKHDDFVDFLANACRGLERLFGQKTAVRKTEKEHAPGTIGWIMADAAYRKREHETTNARAGY